MSSRVRSSIAAAVASPLVIVPVAYVMAAIMFARALSQSPPPPDTLVFPNPRQPSGIVLLWSLYGVPSAWLAMLAAVPMWLLLARRGLSSPWLGAVIGTLCGTGAAWVFSRPGSILWLLPECSIFGGAVGLAFAILERRFLRAIGAG